MVRIGARRGIATIEDERRLSERSTEASKTWDMRPRPDASIEDLSLGLFTHGYLPLAVAREVLAENGRTVAEQLAALRFFDPRRGVPTNGAVLLFGKEPLRFFPSAYVQYVRYDGPDRAADVLEERRLADDLGTVMRGLDELAQHLAVARPVRQPDLSDRTIYDYPPVALHELFMNAVIHRNYDGSGTPVFINHYHDRVEIINPGSLYGGLSESDLNAGSATAYRNPVLAEAARVLGRVNRFGRGIAIARAEFARNQSPEPELKPTGHFFTAVAWKRP
jgi:ATP-dependent DNA helicase RecG